MVIVDSVPVSAPIADFELLLHACDALLLVVFLHKTTREALDSAIQKAQGKLLGTVVNNMRCEISSDYYSYYLKKKPKNS
jgi:Mrp family chromosome partitioning ATPase